MQLTKFFLFLRQTSIYVLATLLGAILTVGVYQVLPSQASPAPMTESVEPTLLAQRQPAIDTTNRSSFVTAAVDRVGAAVVRIDNERPTTPRAAPRVQGPAPPRS